MTRDLKLAWLAIVFLACIALTMFFSALAQGAESTLADRIAALVPAYASKKGEPVDARELGEAIAGEVKGNPKAAALLLTIAIHESGLRESVRLDQYTEHQGDAYRDSRGELKHRASGLWQCHRNAHNAPEWGSSDLTLQVHMAARIAAGAFARCKHSLAPYPINVFRAYGGRNCDMPLKGEDQRAATFANVLRRLQ